MRWFALLLCLLALPAYAGSGGAYSEESLVFCRAQMNRIDSFPSKDLAHKSLDDEMVELGSPAKLEAFVKMTHEMIDLFDKSNPAPAARLCLEHFRANAGEEL
jgi:hypothetical protein